MKPNTLENPQVSLPAEQQEACGQMPHPPAFNIFIDGRLVYRKAESTNTGHNRETGEPNANTSNTHQPQKTSTNRNSAYALNIIRLQAETELNVNKLLASHQLEPVPHMSEELSQFSMTSSSLMGVEGVTEAAPEGPAPTGIQQPPSQPPPPPRDPVAEPLLPSFPSNINSAYEPSYVPPPAAPSPQYAQQVAAPYQAPQVAPQLVVDTTNQGPTVPTQQHDWGGARPKVRAGQAAAPPPPPVPQPEPLLPSFPSNINSAYEPSYVPLPAIPPQMASNQMPVPQISHQMAPPQPPGQSAFAPNPRHQLLFPGLNIQRPSTFSRAPGMPLPTVLDSNTVAILQSFHRPRLIPEASRYAPGFVAAGVVPNFARGPPGSSQTSSMSSQLSPIPLRAVTTQPPLPAVDLSHCQLPTVLSEAHSLTSPLPSLHPPIPANVSIANLPQIAEEALPDLDIFTQADSDTIEAEPSMVNQAMLQLQRLQVDPNPDPAGQRSLQPSAYQHNLPAVLDDFSASIRPPLHHSTSAPAPYTPHTPGIHKSSTEPVLYHLRESESSRSSSPSSYTSGGRVRRNTPHSRNSDADKEEAQLRQGTLQH